MENLILKRKKIGFLGAGQLNKSIISGLLKSETLRPDQILVSNRSDGKLKKISEQFGVNTFANNEELIDESDIVIVGVKPQDFVEALEPLSSSFDESKIVISLAAGIKLDSIHKLLPDVGSVFRVMTNTAARVQKAVVTYTAKEQDLKSSSHLVEELFSPLGPVIKSSEEGSFEAITIASGSGVGFIFELMLYWQDWLEDHEIDPKEATDIVIQTFLGTAKLAQDSPIKDVEELRDQVVSKRGTTEAGLNSMRELELERILRISFGKALDRDKELSELL